MRTELFLFLAETFLIDPWSITLSRGTFNLFAKSFSQRLRNKSSEEKSSSFECRRWMSKGERDFCQRNASYCRSLISRWVIALVSRCSLASDEPWKNPEVLWNSYYNGNKRRKKVRSEYARTGVAGPAQCLATAQCLEIENALRCCVSACLRASLVWSVCPRWKRVLGTRLGLDVRWISFSITCCRS